MKQGDEGRLITKEAPAVTVMRLRRERGVRMIRDGATSEAIAAAIGVPVSAVDGWRRRVGAGADAPTVPVRPPRVSFAEKNLREMADVPLGAW